MKRRNFLKGLLGTGAVVVSAPVIAKYSITAREPFSGDSPDGWTKAVIKELGTPMPDKPFFTGDLVSISEDGKKILANGDSEIVGIYVDGEVVDMFSSGKK